MAKSVSFVESDCAIGGERCEMWSTWFWASVEADPESIDEDRDPAPITDMHFKRGICAKQAECCLWRRSKGLPE